MKFIKHNSEIITLLAILVAFSTVTAENVSAENVELITNIVYSSQSTGGTTSRGADGQAGQAGQTGQDGQDGQNGQAGKSGEDGQPGRDGSSSASIDNIGTASILVESTVDGAKVIDIERIHDVTGSPSATAVIQTTTNSDSDTEVEIDLNSSSVKTSSQFSFATIQNAFHSLRSIIFKYVSYLL